MANIIAISGASATGKSSLVDELSTYKELSNVIFSPDIFSTVWDDLVYRGLFSEYEDVSRDTEFLCIFIQRVINYYRDTIKEYSDQKYEDKTIIIDSCWIDVAIYSILNMWYTHVVKEVQEGLLSQITLYDDSLSRIYITKYDASKSKIEKYRLPFKRYNVKYNRPLELQYYKLATHFKNAYELPYSDNTDSALFIIKDLQNLGYI